jgi:hypothetical protein
VLLCCESFFHTRGLRSRGTRDIDFAVATQIPNEQLLEKGYRVLGEKILTPRDFKIDIFAGDIIGGIPIKDIINRAENTDVGRKRKNRIKVACLEELIILKYRADREQDYEDLSDIAGTRFTKINWSLLQSLTKDEVEFSEIKNTMNIYRNR